MLVVCCFCKKYFGPIKNVLLGIFLFEPFFENVFSKMSDSIFINPLKDALYNIV